MKIEQCQKKDTNPRRTAIKTSENNFVNKSDPCIVRKFPDSDTKTKNNTFTVLHKGAQFIDSYNSIVRKPSNHFGDADTYFRKTLRSCEDFDFWRKCHLDFTFANNSFTLKQGEEGDRSVGDRKKPRNRIQRPPAQVNYKQIYEEYSKQSKIMDVEEIEETETTADDDEMKEVDDIIVKASLDLEKVAEENQQLLDILGKPGVLMMESNKELSNSARDEMNQNDANKNVIKQLEEAEQQAKDTANVIYELKTRVGKLLRREELTESETKELAHKNRYLKEQMVLFEKRTKRIQYLIEQTNFINGKAEEKSYDISPGIICSDRAEKTMSNIQICNNNQNIGDTVNSGVCSCCSEHNRQSVSSVPTFAKKLCQSYSMQEKLAAENADLECVRFKLQEELLKKDQTLECFQRELGNLQNEMRLVSRENITLNEKLKNLQHKDKQQEKRSQQQPSLESTRLQEYADNTYQLEKQLTDMENDVKCLHEEICAVQKEREHLENHRKMICMSRPCIRNFLMPPCNMPGQMSLSSFFQTSTLSKGCTGKVLKELNDQYEKIENELNTKLNEVVAMRTDYEKLKHLTKEAEEFKKLAEDQMKACEKVMNGLKSESRVSKDQQYKLSAAKKRFKKAQESLEQQQMLIKAQKKQIDEIKNKYLEAQQQLKEQRQQIDFKIKDSTTGGTRLNLGAQIVTSLQDKLEEIMI